jgi:hypothetical protein
VFVFLKRDTGQEKLVGLAYCQKLFKKVNKNENQNMENEFPIHRKLKPKVLHLGS